MGTHFGNQAMQQICFCSFEGQNCRKPIVSCLAWCVIFHLPYWGGAIGVARGDVFSYYNEELFGTPESSKSG